MTIETAPLTDLAKDLAPKVEIVPPITLACEFDKRAETRKAHLDRFDGRVVDHIVRQAKQECVALGGCAVAAGDGCRMIGTKVWSDLQHASSPY